MACALPKEYRYTSTAGVLGDRWASWSQPVPFDAGTPDKAGPAGTVRPAEPASPAEPAVPADAAVPAEHSRPNERPSTVSGRTMRKAPAGNVITPLSCPGRPGRPARSGRAGWYLGTGT